MKENPLPSQLAKPFGRRSLSSGLAITLKIAQVVMSVVFAFVVVAAIVGISLSILMATHSAKVPNGTHFGSGIVGAWTVTIPYLVYGVVASRGALSIVRRLQDVFSSFVADQPFARDNPAHMRAIWVTLVVIEITRITAFILMHGLTAAFAPAANVIFPNGFGNPIDLVRWFLIFVVLILTEVFRRGTQLHEETELTV
jgi:hypothetical protein